MKEITEKIKKEELETLKSIYKIPASDWKIKEEKNSMMYSYRTILDDTQITITFNNFAKEYSIIIGGYDKDMGVLGTSFIFELGGHRIYNRHQKELKDIFDKANGKVREENENNIISILNNIKNKLKWK